MNELIEQRKRINKAELIYHDNGIQIYERLLTNNEYHIFAFTDKAKKNPYVNYLVKKENRDNFIEKLKKDAIARIENKKKKSLEKNSQLKETIKNVKIGDVLSSSWGYEQTNVNFYQVIDAKGCFVTLREISKSFVKKSNYNSGRVVPNIGDFKSEPFKKKIISSYNRENEREYSVRISSFELASLTDPLTSHCVSWGY